MRRLLAITVALLLGFSLTAPLFSVDAASSLPQCCRRSGHHHCANEMTSAVDRLFSSIAPKCPRFPKAVLSQLPHGFTATVAATASAAVFAHPASTPQTEARYRAAHARSRQKRGPPPAILL